jgi:transposase-like protein
MSDIEPRQTLPADEQETHASDPEVLPRAERRQFTGQYKLRILEEVERCTERGQIGALLRREGLYSSHLSKWRQQRADGQLQALSPHKRGHKAVEVGVEELARLQRENERLHARLERAEMIIDVQKNSHGYLAYRWRAPRQTRRDDESQ